MTKLNYNGEEIEIDDELEKGYMELDLMTDDNEELDKTIELDVNSLDKTVELSTDDLNNTQDLIENIGNINE